MNRRLRAFVRSWSAGFAVLAVIGLAVLWSVVPKDRIATVGLRLTFDGADRGRYPNGVPFSPEELIDKVVLRSVFQRLGLSSSGPFEAFARGFFVTRSSAETDKVHQAYQARLADAKLSPVDRSRLEDEYRNRLAAVAGEPEVTLGFRQPSGFVALSPDQVRQILDEVVKTWASDAVTTKGMSRYDIDVLSKQSIDGNSIESAEFIVAVDFLRSSLVRLAVNLDVLDKQPGFAGARLADGRTSTSDLKADLAEALQFRVQPLFRQAVANGFVRDRRLVEAYYQGRLQEVELARRRVALEIAGLQQVLRGLSAPVTQPAPGNSGRAGVGNESGPAVIPQVGEAFIERLLELSDATEDVTYRQRMADEFLVRSKRLATLEREAAFYVEAEGLVRSMRPASFEETPPDFADMQARLKQAVSMAGQTAAQIERLYLEVSTRSLVSGDEFYREVSPFSYSVQRAFSTDRAIVLALLAMVAALLAGLAIETGFLAAAWRSVRSR